MGELNLKRGEVWLAQLNPTKGSEQQGHRPVVIISPDSMNSSLQTKVVIPLTTKTKNWPSRVLTEFKGNKGQAMCEQIRTLSSSRLTNYQGNLSDSEIVEIMSVIGALYATP
ncbi:MAG: type II toxin-antitoxin system PemK/MazF family toxin [Bacteriovoracaceae bacterium]